MHLLKKMFTNVFVNMIIDLNTWKSKSLNSYMVLDGTVRISFFHT